jgi:hypothetical protein
MIMNYILESKKSGSFSKHNPGFEAQESARFGSYSFICEYQDGP